MLVADCYAYGDFEGWTAACEELALALADETTSHQARRRPRIVLSGSPVIWPNFKVPFLVESTGGVVVGDDFCSRSSRLAAPDIPPGSLGSMLSALARRALAPCTCGMIPGRRAQQEALRALVRDLDADGVVCHYLRGCTPVAATQGSLVRALRAAGVPTVTVETDASEEDVEGLRTRIEAFIEMTRQRTT
jgi:benzoyl-CoA reductase/2-hydroxyglutaryl-CoA dehydratase subunit BcrC/BadD/HgdB